MTDSEELRLSLQAEEESHPVDYQGNYAGHVNETGDGWAVWNDEAGEQVQPADSLREAIAESHRLNAQENAWHGDE